MRQGTCKNATEFIFCWPSTAGCTGILRVVCFPGETPMAETQFSFTNGYQLKMASGLGKRVFFQ